MKKFFIFGLVALCLISCQSLHSPQHGKEHRTSTPDGAPTGPIPRFFKLVKPIYEPLSRYGNPASYKVNGQNYSVMSSAKGYKTRGLASWYGTKFHKRRTSSGEPYNMYALTAAHKTLPLPTYLRVKNLENGRTAVVKVNDRGPFHSGRIIDLSFGAAVKLGIFPKGTARVEIETITLEPKSRLAPRQYASRHPAQQHHYYIQAGTFTAHSSAQQLQRKARPYAAQVFVKKERNRYVVRMGPFKDRKSMENTKRALTKHGIKGSFSLIL